MLGKLKNKLLGAQPAPQADPCSGTCCGSPHTAPLLSPELDCAGKPSLAPSRGQDAPCKPVVLGLSQVQCFWGLGLELEQWPQQELGSPELESCP